MPTVLVSGGGSGIGAEAVRLLAQRDYQVVVADIDLVRGREVAEAIGGRFLQLDVGDGESWQQVPEVDFAVLNAGVLSGPAPCPPELWSDEIWAQIRAVNIDGAVLGLRAVLPAMVRRKEGAVVLTASLSGLSPLPSDPLYSASKHFIVGLMRSVALQLSETGVRVMALCPGATDTPIIKSPRRKDLNLLNPRDVATSLVNLLESGVTGTALAVMVGQPVVPWAFKDIPTKSRPGAEREYHA